MIKCKSKKFHFWLSLLFVALPVIMLLESCGSIPYETIYTANMLKEPSQRFQPGEQVLLLIKSTVEGPKTERTLTDYKLDTDYDYLNGTRKTTSQYTYTEYIMEVEYALYAVVYNHTTGEKYETFRSWSVGDGKTLTLELYTVGPGLYTATLKWKNYTDISDITYGNADPIQFEVDGSPGPKHSSELFNPEYLPTFLNNNIQNESVRSWLKNHSTNVIRGWTETFIHDLGIRLNHDLNGDITKVTIDKNYNGYISSGLSFSKTSKEIETILGKPQKISFDPERGKKCPLLAEYQNPPYKIIIEYESKAITPEKFLSRPKKISFLKL